MTPKPEVQEATPEMVKALNQVRVASNDERGVPLEDIVKDPKS